MLTRLLLGSRIREQRQSGAQLPSCRHGPDSNHLARDDGTGRRPSLVFAKASLAKCEIIGCCNAAILFRSLVGTYTWNAWKITVLKLYYYTVNRKNVAVHLASELWKNTLYFYNFCIAVSRKKHFTQSWKIYLPHLNNVLLLPCKNETITFHTYNALLVYDPPHQAWCEA